MRHEWGTALGMILDKRGLGVIGVVKGLQDEGLTIAAEVVEEWLANLYVPGTRVWHRLGTTLHLSAEETELLLSTIKMEVPGEHEKLELVCAAARAGDLPELAARLRAGVMMDRCGTSACVPLAEAVKAGQLAATRYLLEHGSEPNTREIGCQVPLTLADKLGRGDLIRLLLNHGAYGGTDATTGRSALHMLARFPCGDGDDDTRSVERVIKEGVSVNERYAAGPTPLMEALQASNWRMCRLLLTCGATLQPADVRACGDLLDAAKTADPTLIRGIAAIDTRHKGPFPRWFNEARIQGIERIDYISSRALTFEINTTDFERPLLLGEEDSGGASALSPDDFLAEPSNAGRLEAAGLGWMVPYVEKMANGTRFGINGLLRGGTTLIHRRQGSGWGLVTSYERASILTDHPLHGFHLRGEKSVGVSL